MALEPPTMGEALAGCVHREPHSTSEVWAPASRGHLRVDLARGASTHFHPGLGRRVPRWPPRARSLTGQGARGRAAGEGVARREGGGMSPEEEGLEFEGEGGKTRKRRAMIGFGNARG